MLENFAWICGAATSQLVFGSFAILMRENYKRVMKERANKWIVRGYTFIPWLCATLTIAFAAFVLLVDITAV